MIDFTIHQIAVLIGQDLANLAQPIEGADDILRLNIQDQTRAVMDKQKTDLNTRKTLLEQVLRLNENLQKAIEKLIENGYPNSPLSQIPDAALQDIREQHQSLIAFLSLADPGSAATTVVGVVSEKRPTP